MADRLTALIVGASRGLGLALAEEWLKRDARVIATVRSDSEELKTLQERFPGSLEIKIVDVVDVASVRTLRDALGDRKFDVLFVNAGICRAIEKTPSTVDEQDFIDMMVTNALGPMRLIELFEGLVPRERRARRDELRTREYHRQRRPLGALQLQQGGPQHADEMLRGSSPGRPPRHAPCRTRLGAHRHGRRRRQPLGRRKHPVRGR